MKDELNGTTRILRELNRLEACCHMIYCRTSFAMDQLICCPIKSVSRAYEDEDSFLQDVFMRIHRCHEVLSAVNEGVHKINLDINDNDRDHQYPRRIVGMKV